MIANRYKNVYMGRKEYRASLWYPVPLCAWERLDYAWTNPWAPGHASQHYKRRKQNV